MQCRYRNDELLRLDGGGPLQGNLHHQRAHLVCLFPLDESPFDSAVAISQTLPPKSRPGPLVKRFQPAHLRPNSSSESTAPVCRTVLQYGTDYLDSVTYTEYNCVLLGAKTKLSLQNSYSFSSFMNWGPLLESGYSYDESKTSIVPMTGSDSPSTPTTTTTITGVTTTSTSPPPPSSTVPVPVPSNRNTGAIAGGVVGGLAGLGLIVGGLIWALMRRKEKARRNATSVQEVSHVTVMHDGK